MALAHVGFAAWFVLLSTAASAQTIHGTAAYQPASTLPANAIFDATLEDVSRADAAASVLATTRIPAPGPSPISFTIAYDTNRVVASRRYVVRARIRANDRLLFTSDTATPVITGGHPTEVAMTLRPVGTTGAGGGAQTPPASQNTADGLEGTAWNAIELYGLTVAPDAAPQDGRPHLVFGTGGRLSGADGCNRLTGSFTVKGNGITLGQLAGTQMACPKTDEIANRFRAALKGTSHWSIVKERLEFYGATGKPLAVFERRPAAAGAGTLEGTSWQLVKFVGGDDRTLTPDDQSKYTIEFAAGGRVAARIDCNRGRGTWKATSAGQLELGALALTRATCPEGSLHDQIARQWTNVRSFVMRDGHLFLSLMADGGTYEFAPLSGKKP